MIGSRERGKGRDRGYEIGRRREDKRKYPRQIEFSGALNETYCARRS